MMGTFLVTLLVVGIIGIAVGFMIGEDRGGGIIFLGVISLILGLWGGVVTSLTKLTSEDSIYEIETNKPIDPELRITVKDSVTVDTIYVYKIKEYKE